jgi:hypothetical protein
MEVLTKIIGAVVLVILLFCVVAVLISVPLMLLWNWLIPVIFVSDPSPIVQHITFWQALGIALLCSCLFKSTSSSSK